MAQANFTEKEIRLLLGLYANTEHGNFQSMDAEGDYYAGIIGRPVSGATVGRIRAGKWYTVSPSGEIVKSPAWDNVKKPRQEREQAALFAVEAPQSPQEAPKGLREVLEAMAEHMAALEALQRELREIMEA